MIEPDKKKVASFFDCQNLFKSAKKLWGYSYPNFNPIELAKLVISKHKNEGWTLVSINIYTGLPALHIDPRWHHFWSHKLAAHKQDDTRVNTCTRPLRYSENSDPQTGNKIGREKGIDVRISLDMVRMARLEQYDVAVLFSQDNDFTEVAEEIRNIAKEKNRWIKIASAYPDELNKKLRGVAKTDWLPICKNEYDSCIDPGDYRQKTSN